VLCCSCASAVDDVGLKRQRCCLFGSHVLRMRPAVEFLLLYENNRQPVGWVYMRCSTTSEIARKMSVKIPSAVTFLLSAVLALCEYGRPFEIGCNL
jgi:hypothetical protein